MAQFYQIVGPPSLTIEELQRYCPNICLNQEDQQYGQQQVVVQPADPHNDVIVSEGGQQKVVVADNLQYQQPYIIRHEQQQISVAPPPLPPPPQIPEFRAQQAQRQPVHQHQVYYTSDLPVESQVVLQQAQQIIDASMMQQAPAQRQQHVPQQQPQQHLNRTPTSSQLLQQIQQQQHQIQMQQQLQQQQQQQLLQQQQQPQQQIHVQHQPQQMPHQQVVMHATYVNQQGTPNRPAATRLLNQALASPSGMTLVRAQRPPRPRNRAVRPPMQSPQRVMNPSIQGSPTMGVSRPPRHHGPRILNTPPSRSPRPRTPLHQQQQSQQLQQQLLQTHQHHQPPPQLQQQQMPNQQQLQNQQQQIQNQQQMQNQQQIQNQQQQMPPQHQSAPQHQPQLQQQILQQQLHPQQIHLKLTQHQQQQQQRLLNQQQQIRISSPAQNPSQPTRIITPQGIIVQQPPTQPNTSQLILSQRSSPLPQPVKKVVVQPNNANEMDDLEDSITAAVLTKHSLSDTPNQYSSTPPSNQIQYPNPNQYPPQAFEQQHFGQMLMETDSSEDDNQLVTLSNGQRITLTEYKRMHQSPRSNFQQQPGQSVQQQNAARERQAMLNRKEQQRPVQRVNPMPSQTQSVEPVEGASGISEQNSEPQSAKMLIFLQNGEQRLITFTLPKESCTVQEVLEQVNVPYADDIQCMHNTTSEIDYIVTIGSRTRIDDVIENHPILLGGDTSNRSSPSISQSQSTTEQSTPEKMQCDNESGAEEERSPPPRYVDGKLAVCKSCGYTGFDFSRCERCRRVFTEEPKSISVIASKVEEKKKDSEKLNSINSSEKSLSQGDTIKLNLLKPTGKSGKNSTEKKPNKGRKGRGKQPDPEPVILTLSSDEEDSNSSTFNSQVPEQSEQSAMMKEPSLSEIEGGTPDSGIGIDNDDDSNPPLGMQGVVTSLQCRTVRIGSYRYTPKEKVYISAKGIKIVAPSLKDETKEVALQIQIREVVRLLVHFGKGLPVIFLYTMSICGNYIRKCLDMTDESAPYYNPVSKVDAFKRITILPDSISEEAKCTLKKLFGKVMDELSCREANEILVRTCTQETNNSAKMATRSSNAGANTGTKSSNPPAIRQILIYPPGKGGIPINTEDFMCLAQDQFLNDVIIDFYLKHLVHDVLTAAQREKTHIFSTFFYKRLTTKPSKMNKSTNPHEWDSTLTPAQKRHARVKTWTKNVNIFEKDFIVVPINENCHWFVAIICFPSLDGCRSMLDNRIVNPQEIKKRERRSSMLIGSTTITQVAKQEQIPLNCDSDTLSERDEAEAEESDLDMLCDSEEEEEEKPVEKVVEVVKPLYTSEPIKQPCILIFDSLAGASRSRVVATLRDYLTCEYQIKVSSAKKFTKDNIKGVCPKIPQQNNFTDCGLYLLQYVEQFFKDPIIDYAMPIKQLANWFDEIVVTRKREEISNLLKELIKKYNPDSQMTLPDIVFPTLNGKLLEIEDPDTSVSDSEEGEMPRLLKRGEAELQLRKAIRITTNDSEPKSFILKPDFLKKSELSQEKSIIIPIKIHSELVKDIQNTLINNKSVRDKKNNSTVPSANCLSESDTNSILKSRKLIKFDDSMEEASKKFKKNEC